MGTNKQGYVIAVTCPGPADGLDFACCAPANSPTLILEFHLLYLYNNSIYYYVTQFHLLYSTVYQKCLFRGSVK